MDENSQEGMNAQKRIQDELDNIQEKSGMARRLDGRDARQAEEGIDQGNQSE